MKIRSFIAEAHLNVCVLMLNAGDSLYKAANFEDFV